MWVVRIMFEAKLVKGKGKNGFDYVAIDVEIAPNYKKRLFLDRAEIALIYSLYGDKID